MWFCLFLIACFIGMCALQRPVAEQEASCSPSDSDGDALRNFLCPVLNVLPGSFYDDTVKIVHYTGLNVLPVDTDDWWYDPSHSA